MVIVTIVAVIKMVNIFHVHHMQIAPIHYHVLLHINKAIQVITHKIDAVEHIKVVVVVNQQMVISQVHLVQIHQIFILCHHKESTQVKLYECMLITIRIPSKAIHSN